MQRAHIYRITQIIMFVCFFIILEMLMFTDLNFGLLPNIVAIDLMICVFLVSFAFLFTTPKGACIYLSMVFAFLIVFYLVNSTLYHVNYDIFSLQQFRLLGEARAVFRFEFINLGSLVRGLSLGVVFVFVQYLVLRMYKRNESHSHVTRLFRFTTFVALAVISLLLLKLPIGSIAEFDHIENISFFKKANYERYGTLGYYVKELTYIVSPNQNGELPASEQTAQNSDLHSALEGYNVITIMIESGQEFAINPVLTPNIYHLMEDGIDFSNNYSENKTDVSEWLGMAGNYPSVPFEHQSHDYQLDFTMPNILNETYETSYFHDNVPSFYSRGEIMEEMGFENIYFHDDIYPDKEMWSWNGNYNLDSETMSRILPDIMNEEAPFYSFFTTLSMHGPYASNTENINKLTNLGYFDAIDQAKEAGLWDNILADHDEADQERIRYYQALMMDLDVAVGMLLEELEEKKLLDETLLVFYSDHNVYYHDLHLKIHDIDDESDIEVYMYDALMFMYNPTLSQSYLDLTNDTDTRYDGFTSPFVIVPTVLDLLGISFNRNIYFGDSVFLDETHVFYSHNKAVFFTDVLLSDDGRTVMKSYDNYTTDYAAEFFTAVDEVMARDVYINAYYNYVKTKDDG